MVRSIGASRPAVWAIKHLVSPVHRWLYRATGGRLGRWGRLGRSTILLTTTGRRTGQARTTPVFALRDADRFVVCNVIPRGEGTNPWVLNLRAHPDATAQRGSELFRVRAREVDAAELERLWTRLVELWPAYLDHYERGGRRTVFALEPRTGRSGGEGPRTEGSNPLGFADQSPG